MTDLNKISKLLVDEELEMKLEKAYSTILFTSSYVIKLFCKNKREYDAKAITYEYLWDRNMPFLSPRLIENFILNDMETSILILRRLPLSSNMLYMLVNQEFSQEQICNLCGLIKNLEYKLPEIEIAPYELYKNYVFNLNLQMSKLKGKIEPKLFFKLDMILNKYDVLSLFKTLGNNKKSVLVHGNLFSGNIFCYRNQMVVIDPISYNHIARKSFPHMDLATFLVDISIFKSESVFNFAHQNITLGMQNFEAAITQAYFILKLLVRLRFAYMENKLQNQYFEQYVNKTIIENSEKILGRAIQNLII